MRSVCPRERLRAPSPPQPFHSPPRSCKAALFHPPPSSHRLIPTARPAGYLGGRRPGPIAAREDSEEWVGFAPMWRREQGGLWQRGLHGLFKFYRKLVTSRTHMCFTRTGQIRVRPTPQTGAAADPHHRTGARAVSVAQLHRQPLKAGSAPPSASACQPHP